MELLKNQTPQFWWEAGRLGGGGGGAAAAGGGCGCGGGGGAAAAAAASSSALGFDELPKVSHSTFATLCIEGAAAAAVPLIMRVVELWMSNVLNSEHS